MVTVFIRKPNGCYIELARFHFLDDAEKFIRAKRADNDFPADTVFLMEIANNGK